MEFVWIINLNWTIYNNMECNELICVARRALTAFIICYVMNHTKFSSWRRSCDSATFPHTTYWMFQFNIFYSNWTQMETNIWNIGAFINKSIIDVLNNWKMATTSDQSRSKHKMILRRIFSSRSSRQNDFVFINNLSECISLFQYTRIFTTK